MTAAARTATWLVLSCGLAMPAVGAAETAEATHASVHLEHRNVIALFVGRTTKTRRQREPTLAVEYERRFSSAFGAGVIYERVFGDLDFDIAALPLAFHSGPWKAYAAPGLELSGEGDREFMVRLGVEYGFEAGRFEVAPQLDIDFVDGEQVLVFGVTVGYGF